MSQLSGFDGLSLIAEKMLEIKPAQALRAPFGTCCKVLERRAKIEFHEGRHCRGGEESGRAEIVESSTCGGEIAGRMENWELRADSRA